MVDLKKLNPRKILVINTFGIGDVLFTLPFISCLKSNFPGCQIGYIGNKRTLPLLTDYEKVDKVYCYERDEFQDVYRESKVKFIKKVISFLQIIKKDEYDLAFDLSLNRSINFLVKMVGIKVRVGFNYKNRSPFLTEKIDFKGFEKKHVVNYYLDLLESLDLKVGNRELKVTVNEKDKQWAEDFLQKQGVSPQDEFIGILPGAGASWGREARFRRWSQDKYVQLVDKMIEKYSLKIILMGDKNEENLCAQIVEKSETPVIEAFGKTSIGQLMALLQRCRLVILNDGGPLHMAVAVGVKTVSMFGPVDEMVYGPYGASENHKTVTSNILCRPCYRKFRMTNCEHVSCLKNIEVEDVLEKIEEVIR